MDKIFGNEKLCLVESLKDSLKVQYNLKNEITFDKALRGILDQIASKIGLYPLIE
jgi:hypothetical protein